MIGNKKMTHSLTVGIFGKDRQGAGKVGLVRTVRTSMQHGSHLVQQLSTFPFFSLLR